MKAVGRVDLAGFEQLVNSAVAHYWKTLATQGAKQRSGNADRGTRAAVTGGKQMNGFCKLIHHVLTRNGLMDAHIHLDKTLELPGYFRPTKKWDLLVVHEGILLAAMEFKSQRGPSVGNNFNNRSEEAIGTGKDVAIAFREGAFGATSPRPWLGWVMLLEDCPASARPVGVAEPHFEVFPEFKNSSYKKRYELLLRKLLLEKLFDSCAYITSTEKGARQGKYSEPAPDLTMKKFLASLGGYVSAYLAGK